jgi:oxazoline/thiazoline dehydrogenase
VASWSAPASPAVVVLDGAPLARLVLLGPEAQAEPRPAVGGRRYALSRFAYMRPARGDIVLECPLSPAQVVLHDSRAAAVVHLLARPRSVEELSGLANIAVDVTGALVALLLSAGMLGEPAAQETSAAEPASLRSWEFHDLLFHVRSRAGRHREPLGATYRLAEVMDVPPVLGEPARPDDERVPQWIALQPADLDRLDREDPPFARVQEARRSIREYGPEPLSRRQLGEFLYRVGRIADFAVYRIPTPHGVVTMPVAPRPYPGAGALHELDLYVVVQACAGLDAGLYRYDPERHRLGRLPARPDDVGALARDAAGAAMMAPEHVQALVVVSARFARLAWKYSGIAYSLILKDVGVLYQTMYLVATAMGLAPCALGAGDSDLFARAIGSDYYAETSVGEFLLGSRP